ncbi:mannonate dehydratase [Thalassorhabdomicrobium marinisediminis]|uniref:Mannonate dehydratase n=1 Tax=Thalassorhabdomicrobium marinisediminis TaxID=2170577 RepID=A0A2T7G0G7_9RHOB|nr:mannonate dehydratase [Thalassorhabdomicrobium marinisediminis]PVA07907.1 mannonate dehydratase [Thalassorhabdomicrobium marinisediminis]
MQQSWRWFGPQDTVSVADMRQAGVEGVVSALHHIPNGTVWSQAEIQQRQQQIAQTPDGVPTGLVWNVVESLPVSEEIKQQRGDWRAHIENYKQSIRNLAQAGVSVICYNFMPVLDWTRTELGHELPNGARCMRFDVIDFAIFDLFVLARDGARDDFPADVVQQAQARRDAMTDADLDRLMQNVICGLPGAEEGYSLADLRAHLRAYDGIDADRLRQHQIDFLTEVVPVAEEVGARLCCHPDDPPFALLGLPRIMSTEEDYARLMAAVDSPANGITLCSGSLGVRADNDLLGMMRRLGSRVHFVHLRNVRRETEALPNSFHEAAHLEGVTDMVDLIAAILDEEQRRKAEGRSDCDIPFRPDHGQDILSDLGQNSQPGYPAVGRLKGLAELRGIIAALSHPGSAA